MFWRYIRVALIGGMLLLGLFCDICGLGLLEGMFGDTFQQLWSTLTVEVTWWNLRATLAGLWVMLGLL